MRAVTTRPISSIDRIMTTPPASANCAASDSLFQELSDPRIARPAVTVRALVLGAKIAARHGLWSDDPGSASAQRGDVGRVDDQGEGPEGGHLGLPGRAVDARAREEPFDAEAEALEAGGVERREDHRGHPPFERGGGEPQGRAGGIGERRVDADADPRSAGVTPVPQAG